MVVVVVVEGAASCDDDGLRKGEGKYVREVTPLPTLFCGTCGELRFVVAAFAVFVVVAAAAERDEEAENVTVAGLVFATTVEEPCFSCCFDFATCCWVCFGFGTPEFALVVDDARERGDSFGDVDGDLLFPKMLARTLTRSGVSKRDRGAGG